ncbi:MAG TPA: trigger factor [Solirubrobacteraceae bacterium]|jgi:trigger factor
MPQNLTTTVTDLPESRVSVQVHVPADIVSSRVQSKARQLGRQLKIPGFRKGKIPPALVIQRLGREYVLDEAIRDTLPTWYAQAIVEAGITPVGDPKLEIGSSPADGEALEFSIEIGVLPKAQLGEYKGLEVGRSEAQVSEEKIDEEIDKLRERLAKLESVNREAQTGDFLVIDYVGSIGGVAFADGEGRDQLLELGGGNLVEGFEEGLISSRAGEERTVEATFPADYANEQLAGEAASFAVTVKDVKTKVVPEVGEELAADLGFDTLEDLRKDIGDRLQEIEQARVEKEFSQAALDAATAASSVEVPDALIQARAQEMWERTLHALEHRGISKDAYLSISSRSEEEVLAELEPDAEQVLRREAVLAAVVQAESIKPTDEDIREVLAATAEREGVDLDELLERLRGSARMEELREDLAAQQAVELLAKEAKPVSIERVEAREKIWTPESEEPQSAAASGGLWTPDS